MTDRMPTWLLLLITIVALVACLAVPLLPLIGAIFESTGPAAMPRIPAVALEGADSSTAKLLWANDLAGMSGDLPAETVLGIVEVALPDGSRERRAFLNRPGQAPVYLGPLAHRADGVPIELLFADIADVTLIAGYIDPAVHPRFGLVELYPVGDDTSNVNLVGGAARWMQSTHCFVVRLQKQFTQREDWNSVDRLVLYGDGTSVLKEYTFAPPLDTRPLWVRAP